MSRIVVDWNEVTVGTYVYDPTGKPWRVTSRWSDGSVAMVDAQHQQHVLPSQQTRGPVTVEGAASMEEAIDTFGRILGARVVT